MIIGQINGQNATPSDFHEYFSQNTWDYSDIDYRHRDSFWKLGEPATAEELGIDDYAYNEDKYIYVPGDDGQSRYRERIFDLTQADRPQAGSPVFGYRVFTYLEGNENILGSPVAGYMKSMDTMFGVPQRRDDVNIHPSTNKGFYYFVNKEAAIAYVYHLFNGADTEKQRPDYTDVPLHVLVSKIEGVYVDKYERDQGVGQYGEEMNEMKLVDTPLMDMNITKLQEAYWQTAEVIHGTTTFTRGPRVFGSDFFGEEGVPDEYKYEEAFEKMNTDPWKLRFYERYPAALIYKYGLWQYDDLSLGHYDVTKYKDIWSKDPQKNYQARVALYNDYQALRQLFPGRNLPEHKPPEPPRTK